MNRNCPLHPKHKAIAIPCDERIAYVGYPSVATGMSRAGKPYFRPHLGTGRVAPLAADGIDNLGLPQSVPVPPRKIIVNANSPASSKKISQKIGVDKGPFATWHGRKVVISSMGRVTLWVLSATDTKPVKINFSAHGPYLHQSGDRVIHFSQTGISLLAGDGSELWYKSIENLRLSKNGGVDLLAHHKVEIEMQGNERENGSE